MITREKLIRLAKENPSLAAKLLKMAKVSAEKAKTEEGAKKLYKKYLDGLTPEGRRNTKKKPQDFFEKPSKDKSKGGDSGSSTGLTDKMLEGLNFTQNTKAETKQRVEKKVKGYLDHADELDDDWEEELEEEVRSMIDDATHDPNAYDSSGNDSGREDALKKSVKAIMDDVKKAVAEKKKSNGKKASLRNRAIKMAKVSAEKAKTEEGAKRLFDKYMKSLTPEGRRNTKKKPQDFYEKPSEDKKQLGDKSTPDGIHPVNGNFTIPDLWNTPAKDRLPLMKEHVKNLTQGRGFKLEDLKKTKAWDAVEDQIQVHIDNPRMQTDGPKDAVLRKLIDKALVEATKNAQPKPEKKPRENGELPIGDKGQQKRKQMSKAEKLKAYQEAIKNSKSMSPEDKKKALEKSKKPGFDADAALGAMGEEEEEGGKKASLTKVAHRPYLTSEGLDSRKVNKGEGFMLYMIDQAKNNSKFYEGVMLDNGDGTYRVLLRWGALTDSGFTGRIDGAKFDGRMSVLSEREAKAVLMKKYRDKTRKGYVDAFKHKLSKGQYPVGLKRDVGFGWGTQDAAFCIPALRRIRSLLSEASQSLTQMQFASASDSLDMASELAMRDLRSEDSSMAKKILDNITHMQDRASKLMAGDVDSSAIRNWKTALNRLMSYLDKQLSVCHTASRSTLTANDKLRYARLAASLPKGSAQRMAALQVLLGE